MEIIKRRSLLQGGISLLALTQSWARSVEVAADVAVIGGGTGGFAATLAALRAGARVVLTEETDWLGGQLTAQAVPPDEHPWIEHFGCTQAYRSYRDAVRAYYRNHYPLTSQARNRRDLNPGNGTVSRLTHEFPVSVAVLESMLAPYLGTGQLLVLLRHAPEAADVTNDRIHRVTVKNLDTGARHTIAAKYFIDATELGDLLPLTKTEFVTGAEAQGTTGELHAPTTAQPANSQSFTFCFAVDHVEGEDHTIEKPNDYSLWREYVPRLAPPWPGKLFSWTTASPRTLQPNANVFDPNELDRTVGQGNLWVYRRIADPRNFEPGRYRSGITLVNWPQNDFWLADLFTASTTEQTTILQRARQLSLSFLYWMQTEAPGPRDRPGWKGLRLRGDIVGTSDGLAKSPYIRESRRIEAEFTILEKHVGTEMRSRELRGSDKRLTAERFAESVGIGCYRIDLHPSAGGTNYIDIGSLPFQIPLGALLPKRMENLLAGAKNIGTTHITNGCYRLHPVEWNIGEAAGALAAFCLQKKQPPRAVRNHEKTRQEFQASLFTQGFELEWPDIHPV